MGGGQHVALHPQGDQHGGQAAEDGVGHVVGEGEAGEAHHSREGVDHYIGDGADDPDCKSRQHVEGHQLGHARQQTVVEGISGTRQQQGAQHEGQTAAEAVDEATIGDAAQGERDNSQGVGGQRLGGGDAIHLLQVGGGHQDHHHDPGGEQPGQQHGDDDAALVLAQHRLERQLLGQGLVGLHLGKDRGLVQPAAQVHGDDAEYPAEDEGQAPAPLAHIARAHAAVDGGGDQGAEQNAGCQPGGQGATG